MYCTFVNVVRLFLLRFQCCQATRSLVASHECFDRGGARFRTFVRGPRWGGPRSCVSSSPQTPKRQLPCTESQVYVAKPISREDTRCGDDGGPVVRGRPVTTMRAVGQRVRRGRHEVHPNRAALNNSLAVPLFTPHRGVPQASESRGAAGAEG